MTGDCVALLQSVTFHKFVVQAGTDASLVPTEMSTLNATVKLTFRNTGSFFGVHVTAQPLTLNYYQLVLASGNVSFRILCTVFSIDRFDLKSQLAPHDVTMIGMVEY